MSLKPQAWNARADDTAAEGAKGSVPIESPAVKPQLQLRETRPVIDPETETVKQGQRLAEARKRNGYKTASDAARALGIAPPTYLAHENGTRQIRSDIAQFYAKHYNFSAQWLLFGTEAQQDEGDAPQPAGRPPTLPTQGRLSPSLNAEEGGWTQLLRGLNAKRPPEGSHAVNEPFSVNLPPARLANGYIPEIETALPNAEDCWLELGGPLNVKSLALRDYFRLPLDMIERPRLVVVKLTNNSLFYDMPGGQRVVVDPDDRAIDEDGAFIATPTASHPGLLVPVLIVLDNNNVPMVYRKKHRSPVPFKDAGLTILGRIVIRLATMNENYLQSTLDHLKLKEVVSRSGD